ncbi:MAG: DNA primase [Clostridiales Family XIII bacterium]|jgi:DNA primase|nr:DNA primase [Clostridiales Family XIII bacterium]
MENIADLIKDRCNIVDVIGRQVELRKRGSSHVGLCPFHREKTPSFTVSEERQTFNCFGCGVGGDVIKFVQLANNLSFLEAAEKLAEDYGIQWDRGRGSGAKKDVYYEANKAAAMFFYDALRKSANPAAFYMGKRGVTAETIKRFGIGYADARWDSLLLALTGKGIDEKILAELGLISLSNGRRFDKFRDRVMFPILNTRGKVIAFGGRVMGDGQPKYLNSPETAVFRKKDGLYALNVTRQDILKQDAAILAEGYMDVISLYQHGVRNVTASLGTALTQEQAGMLKRYTGNVLIAYDSDQAGVKAALRGIETLKAAGCSVRVLRLKGAKDPDEYIKSEGRDAFLRLVDEAPSATQFQMDLAREGFDLGAPEGKLGFLREAARILRKVSPMEAEVYIRKTAAEAGISEGALRAETLGRTAAGEDAARSGGRPLGNAGGGAAKGPAGASRGVTMMEKNLIRLILLDSRYFAEIEPYEGVFAAPTAREIYGAVAGMRSGDEEIDLKKLQDALDAEGRAALEDILNNVRIAGQEEAVLADCLQALKLRALAEREEGIIGLLGALGEGGEEAAGRVRALTEELLAIQREMKEVKGR